MELALAKVVRECGIEFESVSKSSKIRLLSRWNTVFAPLAAAARKGHRHALVEVGNTADEMVWTRQSMNYYLIPDDESGQPCLSCTSDSILDLGELVSDTANRFEEIIILDAGFAWSFVLVNHGTSGPGRYFMEASVAGIGRETNGK